MLEEGRTIFSSGLDPEPLHDLFLLTTKPFIYVFNCDQDQLGDADFQARMEELVAPAEAIFLDAEFEAELAEMEPEDAAEFLAD
ncbi:MAG: GTP-binding protein YchF, partial [Propionibacterium sp. DORA_15]